MPGGQGATNVGLGDIDIDQLRADIMTGQPRPMGPGPGMPGQVWRHPQEVTLQQRGPQMAVQGTEASSSPPMVTERSAPPAPCNLPAPPTPPENPQNDDERKQVWRYEQWLVQQEGSINQSLKYYETEITKLRKQRKSLNSKQRTLRKNGNELGEQDASELERVSNEASGLQKSLENIRKQSRQHAMIMNDHRQKRQKALEAAGHPPGQAQQMSALGGPPPGMGPGPGPGMIRAIGPNGQPMMRPGMPAQQQPGWQGSMVQPGMVHVQRSVNPGGPQVRPAVMGGFQGQQQMPGQPGQPMPQAVQQRMALQQQQQQQIRMQQLQQQQQQKVRRKLAWVW